MLLDADLTLYEFMKSSKWLDDGREANRVFQDVFNRYGTCSSKLRPVLELVMFHPYT